MSDKLYAEDVGHYWQTSRSTSADAWIGKAKREIAKAGGSMLVEAFGHEITTGRSAYVLGFSFDEDQYRLTWPVLESRAGKESAARVQAATFLYHDVKAKCMSALVLGHRAAFFSYFLLPSGQTAAQVAVPELIEAFPPLLTRGM